MTKSICRQMPKTLQTEGSGLGQWHLGNWSDTVVLPVGEPDDDLAELGEELFDACAHPLAKMLLACMTGSPLQTRMLHSRDKWSQLLGTREGQLGVVEQLLVPLQVRRVKRVLDAVVSDAAEHLAELNVQKELANAGTHLKGHVGESDITVEDFVENCRQFEDRLCEKYGVQKA
eukprot:Skav236106  [mRNA]  locus=scaffold1166:326797:328765:+ [translate_table: standard]